MSSIGCRLASVPAALRRASAGGVLALLLTGCVATTTAPWGVDLGDYRAAPRDLIAVGSYAADHTIRLDHGGAISQAERNKLGAFLVELAHNRPESLRVIVHGRANPAQERAITTALVGDGVSPEHIVWARHAHDGPAAPRGTVVLAIERAVAIAPSCPGYMGHGVAPEDNFTEPNLGCADAYNFAAMVGDPHDLHRGASSIYYSGQRGASDVAAYRDDKVKPLPRINEGFSVGGGGGR